MYRDGGKEREEGRGKREMGEKGKREREREGCGEREREKQREEGVDEIAFFLSWSAASWPSRKCSPSGFSL